MTDEAKKIVNALRIKCYPDSDCSECPADYYCHNTDSNLEDDAADLIERMSAELDRLKEKRMQKPMTLEEACRTEEPCVFVEFKDKPEIRVSNIRCYSGGCLCEIISISLLTTTLHSSSYGKMWRCWATNPTDEERKAAKWDE